MSQALKMVFSLPDSKSVTLSLSDPKNNLAKAAVLAAANEIIAKNALVVDEANPTALKDAYIYTTERTELVES